ncbi:hypothetical protein [Tabrizicola soli]|uniref:Uncharacterized protein n=1 Tax=Tabrizicola soli TaxID=2185115 RepID=A0ABV7DR13_9RHOB|nr:hypothetical protein [Tabrizicola soli]
MSEDHDKNCDPSWGPDLGPESSRKGKKKGKEGALNVAPIHGVLPFAGARNPLIRSNTARKVSFTACTLATDGVPQVYHFDSEAESAAALEALLHPDLHGLEVQLPAITYRCRRSRKNRDHHFDLRITFRDGFRRAIFVRMVGVSARLRRRTKSTTSSRPSRLTSPMMPWW